MYHDVVKLYLGVLRHFFGSQTAQKGVGYQVDLIRAVLGQEKGPDLPEESSDSCVPCVRIKLLFQYRSELTEYLDQLAVLQKAHLAFFMGSQELRFNFLLDVRIADVGQVRSFDFGLIFTSLCP